MGRLEFLLVVSAAVVAIPRSRPARAVETKEAVEAPLERIEHIVVIYEENHSFDDLYGGWEGVVGRASADPAHTTQISQAGKAYACLRQNDINLSSPPLAASCSDTTTDEPFSSAFGNAPFSIDARIRSSAKTCPKPVGAFEPNGFRDGTGLPGGCTKDITHRFYQEQYQLNDGNQNRYVTASDAVGLVMGYYDTRSLPIYRYLHRSGHPPYAIADNFFQGAFGGSFLNHQWLIAAATPVFKNALNDGSGADLHSIVDENGMPASYLLYTSPLKEKVKDKPLTASCNPPADRPPTPPGIACGDHAVNTVQPWHQPYAPGTPDALRMPPLENPTIGDELSAKQIEWAWYSGGWSNADGQVNGPGWTNGDGPRCADPQADPKAVFPNCPDVDFQYHHQPFNYFARYAPCGVDRTRHLRDEEEFLALTRASVKQCRLRAVSFVKPVGEENEHPGYASVSRGSEHLVSLLEAIRRSACVKNTMVVVAYDEFGGQWDHVPPPGKGGKPGPNDEWGPGTRIPVLVLSPFLRGPFVVDHTQHDTTSIIATIEHRYGLQALGERDAAVADLSSVYSAAPVK